MLMDPTVQEVLMDITNDEESSVSIIECLLKGKTTDEEIAEETEIRLNIVRKVLYKLYDAGVASYKRSKDPETQWYTYSWKFEEEKVADIITHKYENFSREIEEALQFEEGNMFFVCLTNGCRYRFDEASENNFICPKCGGNLEYQDNSAVITELKEMMQKMS
ncbi:transcription factor E [Methanobacterium aggregans]|uniref:transcription factor E n=1 Tax=Methanobacterium aggregans TaxID=1615586 RepID=UPI001AE7DBEB|nr:transcription factor E [Methanobacterium aggregans]MBP2045582.1 transcription initiation factor TFIIE subunit alpha [Methanobacterium aggregans]